MFNVCCGVTSGEVRGFREIQQDQAGKKNRVTCSEIWLSVLRVFFPWFSEVSLESGENPLSQGLCQNLYQSFPGHTQLERDLFQLIDTRVLSTRPSLVVRGGVLCLLLHPAFSQGLRSPRSLPRGQVGVGTPQRASGRPALLAARVGIPQVEISPHGRATCLRCYLVGCL